MILAGLFILILLKVVVLIIGGCIIKNKESKPYKVLDVIYTIITCVMIAYAVRFIIYIFNSYGYYSLMENKIFFLILLGLLIIFNLSEIIVDILSEKNIYNIITSIFETTAICSMVLSAVFIVFTLVSSFMHSSYVLPGDRNIISKFEYERIRLVLDDKNDNYNLIIDGKNGEEYKIDKEVDDISAEYEDYEYVERYEVKVTSENAYGHTKKERHYEYILHTDDSNQANWVNLYGLK